MKCVSVSSFYKIIINLIQLCAFVVLNYGDSHIYFCYSNEIKLPEEGGWLCRS